MNFLDKAISVFSPKWAAKRAYYRECLRAYEAGEINRFNDTWVPVNSDSENTDKTERDLIKARARYLERNSDMASSAIGAIVRNSIGVGIKPQARSGDEKLNTVLEKLWKEWVKHSACDITKQQTFYEIQAMLLRRKVVDGEILIKLVIVKKAKIPLKLQVIKSDMLDSYMVYAPKTNNVIRSGIELDEYLCPVAYWIQRKSPDGYINYESSGSSFMDGLMLVFSFLLVTFDKATCQKIYYYEYMRNILVTGICLYFIMRSNPVFSTRLVGSYLGFAPLVVPNIVAAMDNKNTKKMTHLFFVAFMIFYYFVFAKYQGNAGRFTPDKYQNFLWSN